MDITKLFILLLSLFVSLSSATTSVVDFCVADSRYPKGPAGYSCKTPSNVTIDDFVFSGFRAPGNTSQNIFKVALTQANDESFPGMNGLGLSMIRADIGVGGVIPLHTHRSSEVVHVVKGTIIAGFISSDPGNVAYYKTLRKGDIIILPQSLLHFQVNTGEEPATLFTSLNSANAGFQTTSLSLFSNSLPTEIIEKITLIDDEQVRELKTVFGGTN